MGNRDASGSAARPNGLTVGVTFFLYKGKRSIWANGGMQNAVFLVHALERCSNVARVIPINGGDGDVAPAGMMFDGLGLEFKRFEECQNELDVYVECGAQIPAWHAERVHERGGIVAGYRFGNHFVLDAEKLITGKGDQHIFNGTRFDVIWTNAQHLNTNRSYWEAVYRCPVVCLPHIWEPLFVEKCKAEFDGNTHFGYAPPHPTRRRIAVYEPNIDVVKMCHIPMIAADLVYRDRPELIDTVEITNAIGFAGQETFKSFATTLEINRAMHRDGGHVCRFHGRYNIPWFQATHADIMLAWQWENALNYAYYEALYGHYPLVHNSDLLPEGVGYRYHGFDAHDGARALREAITKHDARRREYDAAADWLLASVMATAPLNVRAHESAIEDVTTRRLAA